MDDYHLAPCMVANGLAAEAHAPAAAGTTLRPVDGPELNCRIDALTLPSPVARPAVDAVLACFGRPRHDGVAVANGTGAGRERHRDGGGGRVV
ncbi:hypothetical protein ACFVGM_18105 [Kitasatospora purpeofusca]|uniref:hypothetical protein n=1 Tax=Kitasatospora purpeofusca TaxID=67352 RepID=UPI0036BE0040